MHAAILFGTTVDLIAGSDAETLILRDKVQVLIGGFDLSECRSLSERAESTGLLFMNVGCGADVLRGAECAQHTFHVAASDAMRRDALALAEGDTRPKTVELWHHSLEAFGAGQVNARFRHEFDQGMDSDAWATWMGVKIAAEAAFRTGSAEPERLIADLERPATRFDGQKGRPLSFRPWDHQLRQPLYIVRPAEPESPVVEVPPRGAGGRSAADQLDLLGAAAKDRVCRWEQ